MARAAGLLLLLSVVLITAGCGLFDDSDSTSTPAPTATAGPGTAEPTPTPESTPDDEQLAAELAVLVRQPIVEEFGPRAEGLDVRAFPLGLSDERGAFWGAVTNGAQPFYLDDEGNPVNFFHFVAVYRRAEDGSWSDEIDRLVIKTAPQRTSEVELVSFEAPVPGSAGNAWIVIRGPTGAHSGTLDLIRFDGDRLSTVLSHVSARPNAGEIVDLDGDGVPEIVVNDSNPFVFCYACAVEEEREIVYRWDGAGFRAVELAAPSGLDPDLASDVDRVVALAEADLWREAAALAVETARHAPGTDELRWLSILVNRNAAARLARAGSPGQPLLMNVFAGEYGPALELMRAHPPAEAFALDGPLIVDTAAEQDLTTMAVELLDYAERAAALRPEDAAVRAVQALGLALASPDDLDRARQALGEAVAAAPDDAYLADSLAFLESIDVTPGTPPDAPGPEGLLPAPERSRFDQDLTIGSGDRGAYVRALQQRLSMVPGLGFEDPGRYYDVYDEATRQAVLQLQIDAGLTPTGVVDGPTWDALEAALQQPPGPPSDGATTRPPQQPPAHGASGEPIVYLTFDDGPHPTWTPEILDVLARHGVLATFFILGVNATNFPQLVSGLVDAGNRAENHTFDHPSLDQVDRDVFVAEVQDTDEAIREAAGERVEPIACLRPPYGATDSRTNEIAAELGKTITLWDVDTQDWRRPGADQIASHVLANVRPGAIVLMHDGGGDRSQTVEALDSVLTELAARGYAFSVLCTSGA